MSMSPRQLLLLADNLKLSLLERQRAISLKLEPNKQDSQIQRSLETLREGLSALESMQPTRAEPTSDLSRVRTQYEDFYVQFYGEAPPSAKILPPGDDTPAVPTTRRKGSNKSVRFRDDPDDEDPEAQANRAALFSAERYTDEPDSATPDQSHLDNQQIHAYHKQVLQEQDTHLNTLGESIGRQRILGIQMGNELDEQVELLDDIERGVDRHTDTLTNAQRRLGRIARKSKDNWNWITIAILIIILVLLIIILK